MITVESDNLIQTKQELEKILLDNPKFAKDIKKIIRKALTTVVRAMRKEAKGVIKNDPRRAYMAVKSTVYRRILGGNVNIFNSRKASSYRASIPERPERTGRGGNRLERSARTEQVMSYWGKDRGFILRFLNSGTDTRSTRYGNRGSISARNWFGARASRQMDNAAENISRLIDELIQKELSV